MQAFGPLIMFFAAFLGVIFALGVVLMCVGNRAILNVKAPPQS